MRGQRAPVEAVVDVERGRAFSDFYVVAEPRLRRALVAAYGTERGREATAEALAWAWEHWARLEEMGNPVGYLYRVGQSRSRARKRRPVFERPARSDVEIEPELPSALAALSERQRVAVVLVHGFEWTHREVAELTGTSPTTVQNHVERGLHRLRQKLNGVGDG